MPRASSPNNSIDIQEYTLHQPTQRKRFFKFKLKYNYRRQSSQFIDKMCRQYHNCSLIQLEHQVQYHKEKQLLKRYYQMNQFQFKITSLAQYYKYHREMPRFFQLELHQILTDYQQSCRNQECQRVSKKIQQEEMQQKGLNQKKQQKKNIRKPVQKLIKNIQLSYLNFQNKNLQKKRTNSKSIAQKLRFHDIKKTFNTKNSTKQQKVESKIHNIKKKLQAKYSSQILTILKSKRSSSKSFNLKEQQMFNKPKAIQKIKDQKCNKLNSANSSLNSGKNNLSRSKSKSNLHSYKSSKILLTKDQLNEKKVPLGQQLLQTNRQNLNYETIKKKLSSARSSIKKCESSCHLMKKIQSLKSVKVCEFEIKKNSTTKLNCKQNQINQYKQKKQKQKQKQRKVSISISREGKQNKMMSRKCSQSSVKTMFNKVLKTKKRV